MDEFGIGVVETVQLQDHFLGQTGSRRRDTSGSGQIHMIVIAHLFDVAHLEDSPVHITIETIAQFLGHMTQVQIVVGNLTQIDMLAEIGVCGVGSTVEDGLGISQVTVCRLSCGGTCEDSHLELTPCLMLGNGNLC